MKNWAKKGHGLGHVAYFWILGPPIISGEDEATNVKFCSQIEGKEYWTKNEKLGQKGAWPRSRDILLNYGTPYYLRLGWSYKRQILQPDRG